MVKLEKLNRREAIRYLGGAKVEMNEKMQSLMDECEHMILTAASPKYLYRLIDLPCDEIVRGKDVADCLKGCERAVIMCATLGGEVDRLIRIAEISDMAKAVVLDSFASTAVEQVCFKVDEMLAQKYPDFSFTFRFSPGYGDYPIEMQRTFLDRLDAPRKIGLTVNDNSLLIPSKSVTAVAGMSKSPIERKKRGCAVCNMRNTCKFRRNGEHCEF